MRQRQQRQQKPLASSICKQHPDHFHCDYLDIHHQKLQHNYNHNHQRDHHLIKETKDNLLSDADNNLEQLSIADAFLVLGSSPREKFHSRGKMNQRGFNESVSECRKSEQNVKLVWLSILLQPWARIIKLHLLSSQFLLISWIIKL